MGEGAWCEAACAPLMDLCMVAAFQKAPCMHTFSWMNVLPPCKVLHSFVETLLEVFWC